MRFETDSYIIRQTQTQTNRNTLSLPHIKQNGGIKWVTKLIYN